MRLTEIRNAQIGVADLDTPQGKFWRLTLQDEQGVIYADIPDEVMRAMAAKITSGVHIDVARKLPNGLKLQ